MPELREILLALVQLCMVAIAGLTSPSSAAYSYGSITT